MCSCKRFLKLREIKHLFTRPSLMIIRRQIEGTTLAMAIGPVLERRHDPIVSGIAAQPDVQCVRDLRCFA